MGNMRTSKIRKLLQQGREGEKAAAKMCRDLHERRLMPNTIILQMMIDHCVNSDFEWPVAADEGALMWYYMGKSSNAPKTPKEHNREVIDLHNCTRGLASVTLVDRLLLLRSKWIEADPDADIVKGGVLVIVGKGKGTGKGQCRADFVPSLARVTVTDAQLGWCGLFARLGSDLEVTSACLSLFSLAGAGRERFRL